MSRFSEIPYGTIQKTPDGKFFEIVKTDTKEGFERREISEEEYRARLEKMKSFWK